MTEPAGKRDFEKLGTPEHLDRVLQVTTPKTWIALFALIFMLTAVAVWSVLGEVATYIRADGIILGRGGEIFDAAPSSRGRLVRILPTAGDTVNEGDIVAEIFDPATMERHTGAVALVEERKRELDDLEIEANTENELAELSIDRQRAHLDELQRTGSELIENTRNRLAENRAQMDSGAISRETGERGELALEQALEQARLNLFEIQRRRDELEIGDLRRRNGLGSRIMQAKARLAEAERLANELATLIDTWRVPAPVSGRVIEIKAQPGDTLAPGQAVLGIQTGEEGLDVLFYVSAADGTRIEKGMRALVSPTNVRREEFGSMIGTVQHFSEFPASLDGMIAVLQNRDLALKLSRGGAPYPGRIVLSPHPTTTNGFSWTAPQAENVEVMPGTLAEVEVELSRRPPIALIAPWVAQRFGS